MLWQVLAHTIYSLFLIPLLVYFGLDTPLSTTYPILFFPKPNILGCFQLHLLQVILSGSWQSAFYWADVMALIYCQVCVRTFFFSRSFIAQPKGKVEQNDVTLFSMFKLAYFFLKDTNVIMALLLPHVK